MIIVNSLSHYNVPGWLKHAPWNGYRFPDLVAPMFLFAMGVAYRISLNRRISHFGVKRAVLHLVERYIILFLFGFTGILMVKRSFDWGILQMLGAVGLFALPIMFLPPLYSIITSIILLALYQISINNFDLLTIIAEFDLGGPFATLAWCFILTFAASVIGVEISRGKERTDYRRLLLIGIILALAGLASSLIVPLNKHLVSSSYVIFSAGLATVLFSIFYALVEIHGLHIGILDALGKNSLTIFIFSSLISTSVGINLPNSAPVIYPVLITVGLLACCVIIAEILARHEIYIKL